MRQFKATLGVVCATALLTIAAVPAAAQVDTFNRTTKITFSAPVELPTMTLPAGTYTFRLTDSTSDRHVVQVFDENGAKLITMLHAMPARRAQLTDEHVITFRETVAGTPAPLRFWYYTSDYMGQEFAYPKERALEIARLTGESVLAIDGDQITRVDATMATTAEPAPVTPVEPAPVTPPDTHAAHTETAPTSDRLPQTASPMPLVGLIGLVSLGGGIALRSYRKRSA